MQSRQASNRSGPVLGASPGFPLMLGGSDTTHWAPSGVLILEPMVEAAPLQCWGLPSPDTPPCVSLTLLRDLVGCWQCPGTSGAADLQETVVPPSGNAAGLAFRRPPVSVPQRHGREWPCDTVLWPAEARSGLALAGLTAEVCWAPRVGWGWCVLQVRVRGCDTVRAVRIRVLWVCVCPRVAGRQRCPPSPRR